MVEFEEIMAGVGEALTKEDAEPFRMVKEDFTQQQTSAFAEQLVPNYFTIDCE